MKIEYKGETTDWVKKGIQLNLLVNGKEVTAHIETYSSDFDLGGDLTWSVDVTLTDKEVDEVDNFIRNNY